MGPQGTSTLSSSPGATGLYTGRFGGGLRLRQSRPPFLQPGKYQISGQGGPDVGAFTAEVLYDTSLEWVGAKRFDTIDRSRGTTLKWRGVAPRDRVIVAALNVDPLSGGNGDLLLRGSRLGGPLASA